jgi:hypothetical protein
MSLLPAHFAVAAAAGAGPFKGGCPLAIAYHKNFRTRVHSTEYLEGSNPQEG